MMTPNTSMRSVTMSPPKASLKENLYNDHLKKVELIRNFTLAAYLIQRRQLWVLFTLGEIVL